MQTNPDIQTHPAIGDRGLIDISTPDSPGPHPFVIVIHGGGWANGDRHTFAWVAPRLAAHGFASVMCSYRVSSEARFPGAYDDMLHLFRWLHEYGSEYNLDPSRAAMLGGSAGGHLVALLACRLAGEGDDQLRPRCGVSYGTVPDVRALYPVDVELGRTVTVDFMGDVPDALPEAYRAASPIDHVHADAIPLMLIHGEDDTSVPPGPTVTFAAALKHAGAEVELHLLPGRGHSMCHDKTETPLRPAHEEAVINFLKKHLD